MADVFGCGMDGDIKIGNRVLLSRDSSSQLPCLSNADRIAAGLALEAPAGGHQPMYLDSPDDLEQPADVAASPLQPSRVSRPRKSNLRQPTPFSLALATEVHRERDASCQDPHPAASPPAEHSPFAQRSYGRCIPCPPQLCGPLSWRSLHLGAWKVA